MPRIPNNNPEKKLPLVVYIHGGGFSIASAFHLGYHKYVSSLVAQANVIAVSVDHRLAPEHPIPACYVHPYFGGTEDDKMWLYMCPENSGWMILG